MTYTVNDLPAILRLLEDLCTREQIDDLLRSIGAARSAPNKKALVRERVQQAFDERRLDLAKAVGMIRSAEEHGRQHVYLYQRVATEGPSLNEALSDETIEVALREIGIFSKLTNPRVLDVPEERTISEVRVERYPKGQIKALVVKQVEAREIPEGKAKREKIRGQLVTSQPLVRTRGVHLVRLQANGVLEIRLQSDRTVDYEERREALRTKLEPLFPAAQFPPVSLASAKRYLWDHRDDAGREFRLSWAKARQSNGDSAVFAVSAPDAYMQDRPTTIASLSTYLDADGAMPDGWIALLNVPKPGTDDFEELRCVLTGEPNEFSLTAQCSEAQYEYALGKLRQYNG